MNTSINIHPSEFQTSRPDLIGNDSIVKQVQSNPLINRTLDSLVSPGAHHLNGDSDELSEFNQKAAFKGLYGDTLLTDLFFSRINITNIQKLLRYVVHKEMNYVIDDQSEKELLTIMRSIFLTYSEHPLYITPDLDPETVAKLKKQYTDECHRLNKLVVNETVPIIASALQQYVNYLDTSSRPLAQIDRPVDVSIAGTRQLRSVSQVLSG